MSKVQQMSKAVLVPGGTFKMGSDRGHVDELPIHEVYISTFYMDERVVNNREYQYFIDENPEWHPDNVSFEWVDENYLNLWVTGRCPEELLDHSVINVSRYAALAFAKWVGKRLPTEAEWEYAAGGRERFEYGVAERFDPSNHVTGLDGGRPKGAVPATLRHNSYGLYDVSGLGWEWTQDSYDADWYPRSPRKDPCNTDPNTEWCVLRGSSAYFQDSDFMRIHLRGRNSRRACNEDYGFRCARDLDEV